MKNYEHITKYENTMVEHQAKLQELSEILKYLKEHQDDYKALLNYYYYSEERNQDLEDDEKHLIPEDLKRGVLSEDGVYNLSHEYRESAIEMMEVALEMIKRD